MRATLKNIGLILLIFMACLFLFRNLYPYELFITGQDFTKALEKFSLKPRVKKTKNVESVIKQEHGVNNNADNGTSDYGISL